MASPVFWDSCLLKWAGAVPGLVYFVGLPPHSDACPGLKGYRVRVEHLRFRVLGWWGVESCATYIATTSPHSREVKGILMVYQTKSNTAVQAVTTSVAPVCG